MLERPLTSRVSDWIIQRRGSEGSEAVGPADMPKDAFHFARDWSSASAPGRVVSGLSAHSTYCGLEHRSSRLLAEEEARKEQSTVGRKRGGVHVEL